MIMSSVVRRQSFVFTNVTYTISFLQTRDAEARVVQVGRDLEEAQNYVLQLNKSQYEG